MKLRFITIAHVNEAVKYLVAKDGGHLPYTDADGSPNHRLMGAAWAALHGGYRGNKYDGPDKDWEVGADLYVGEGRTASSVYHRTIPRIANASARGGLPGAGSRENCTIIQGRQDRS